MLHCPADWSVVTIVTPVMDLGAYDLRDVFCTYDSCDQVRRPALNSGGGERGLSGFTRGPRTEQLQRVEGVTSSLRLPAETRQERCG